MLTAAGVINARELKRIADEKETEKLQQILTRCKEEEEERHARQDFMEREVMPEGLERLNAWVRRAAEQGHEEVEILRFPSHYCTDQGRAINNFEECWPDTLTGFARKVYDAYVEYAKPQGFTIRAQILNYPDGGLGKVGMFIGW